mmetsp:Transcript_26363/g.61943  ORF Transcript_26363/g.61943 Transcript_26363/m.61943 type:complete len:95 (+) Transcript_26363:215-499(+)
MMSVESRGDEPPLRKDLYVDATAPSPPLDLDSIIWYTVNKTRNAAFMITSALLPFFVERGARYRLWTLIEDLLISVMVLVLLQSFYLYGYCIAA